MSLVVAGVLVLSVLVRTQLVGVYNIPSESMQHTLEPGDRVAVAKWRGGEGVERGDVVVFDGQGTFGAVNGLQPGPLERALGALEGHDPRNIYVKRVIGIGGDHVQCCDATGRIEVNGVPLDEPYIFAGDAASEQKFNQIVPRGHVWLMGDHRSDSADSRAHQGSPGGGMVAVDDVIGPVLFRYWPTDRFGTLDSGKKDEDADR